MDCPHPAEGVTLPVHLGTPGVLEMTKLLRIAAQIGVADRPATCRRTPA